jgi:hypothetical protein
MSYELTLHIPDNSPQEHNIEAIAEAEHITREEAALRLLAVPKAAHKATPEALRIVGLLSAPEDAALMDEVMELVTQERERRNAEPPRV